ncbi:hypothetical protein L6452_34655 [Arctium lappa]|uniref:Uncharacterized protein n=1 Tax=Arctium lappa TaxID=4217 RepID=A0ACB8YJU1_ARCLA|nr:hypothetical protein L6452_34655 [Arctium lappa]
MMKEAMNTMVKLAGILTCRKKSSNVSAISSLKSMCSSRFLLIVNLPFLLQLDMVTPMCSQLTYEGLMDEQQQQRLHHLFVRCSRSELGSSSRLKDLASSRLDFFVVGFFRLVVVLVNDLSCGATSFDACWFLSLISTNCFTNGVEMKPKGLLPGLHPKGILFQLGANGVLISTRRGDHKSSFLPHSLQDSYLRSLICAKNNLGVLRVAFFPHSSQTSESPGFGVSPQVCFLP